MGAGRRPKVLQGRRRLSLLYHFEAKAQTILARLCPAVAALAAVAEAATLEEIGTGAFRADIASMRHETQYSRLFRS